MLGFSLSSGTAWDAKAFWNLRSGEDQRNVVNEGWLYKSNGQFEDGGIDVISWLEIDSGVFSSSGFIILATCKMGGRRWIFENYFNIKHIFYAKHVLPVLLSACFCSPKTETLS